MSGFNFGGWKAYLEYRPDMLGYHLYLMRNTAGGREFLTENGTMKIVKLGEQYKNTDKLHFAYFEDDQQLQAIADAISERGVKSNNDHKNEGLLEATKAHLEDMRNLVFDNPAQPPKRKSK